METITQHTAQQLRLKGQITKQIFKLYFLEHKDYGDISKILKKDIHYITNIISRLNNRIGLLSTGLQAQDTQTQDSTGQKPLITHIEQDLSKFIPLTCP